MRPLALAAAACTSAALLAGCVMDSLTSSAPAPSPAPSPVASAPLSPPVPFHWIADANGCKAWNPDPAEGQSIEWSGACENDNANGAGDMRWYADGDNYQTFSGQYVDGHMVEGTLIDNRTSQSFDGTWKDDEFNNGTVHDKIKNKIIALYIDGVESKDPKKIRLAQKQEDQRQREQAKKAKAEEAARIKAEKAEAAAKAKAEKAEAAAKAKAEREEKAAQAKAEREAAAAAKAKARAKAEKEEQAAQAKVKAESEKEQVQTDNAQAGTDADDPDAADAREQAELQKLLRSSSPAQMYSQALDMKDAGRADDARQVFKAIIDRFPDSPWALKAADRIEDIRHEQAAYDEQQKQQAANDEQVAQNEQRIRGCQASCDSAKSSCDSTASANLTVGLVAGLIGAIGKNNSLRSAGVNQMTAAPTDCTEQYNACMSGCQ
jgi:hypothetical protein